MKSINQRFSDNEGNHLLVALCFCDDDYKRDTLHIPEEYIDVEVVDISITKAYVEKPIHFSVFLRMSSWLLQAFEKNQNTIYTFICSTEELETNHPNFLPQEFRWELFDKLYKRQDNIPHIHVQDVVVGPDGYQALGRAFYRDNHIAIINLITAYLEEKQRSYYS